MTFAPRRAALIIAAAALLPAALLPAGLSAQETKPPADQGADQTAGTAPAETAETAAPDIDVVVAVVDGREITLGELILMRANLPEQYQQIPDEQLMPALLDQAVTQALLADEGREAGYDSRPLAKLRADLDMRNYLAEARIRDVVREATGEDKLREAYEAQYANAEPEKEVRASHILVKDKALADEIKAKAEGGADFAELAGEYGTDGTKEQGGDLGWFVKEQMVPAFSDAAFAAEEGVVTGPVESQFGWHLILVTGKRDKPAPAFEEVQQELAESLGSAAVRAKIEGIREGHEVELPETALDPSVIRRDDLLTEEE